MRPESNIRRARDAATGVINFINFTFSALLGPVFRARLVHRSTCRAQRPQRSDPRELTGTGMRALVCVLSVTLALAGCAQYAEVKPKRPALQGPPGPEPLVSAEKEIEHALRHNNAKPLDALGDCVEALDIASRELHRDSANAAARRDYNFALSRIFEIIKKAKLDAWTKPLTIRSQHGEYVLTHKPDPRPEWNPALYDFTPADQFDVGGKYVTERTTRDGIGAPIVAVEWEASKERREKLAPSRIFRTVTAVAQFRDHQCVLEFYDPLDQETVSFQGRTVPLAADFTVPLAVMLQETDPKKHELSRVLSAEKYAHTAAIERLHPFNPSKTVVLVLHGNNDS